MVEHSPDDAFHRCNLAHSLSTAGAVDEALLQLAVAASTARNQISAGCVAVAMRDAVDRFTQQWSLPSPTTAPLRDI